MFRPHSASAVGLVSALLLLTGCGDSGDVLPPKAPRPVRVKKLEVSKPGFVNSVAASVTAWKTEQIGFEVGGRVTRVLEPEAEFERRSLDGSGQEVISEGTVLAELDKDRYRLAVESSQAAIDVAKSRKAAIEVEISDGIPARRLSAEAERRLAEVELDRAQDLFDRDAGTQADLDQAKAKLATATAKVAIVDADKLAQEAELRSRDEEVKQAESQLSEANLDLSDTTLYSSFRGQISEVHVVPGSVVAAGEPVLTVQMMDPIQVEFEVSAIQSRNYRRGNTVVVDLFNTRGDAESVQGYVWATDSVADPQTRTFTVTVLIRNWRIESEIPEDVDPEKLARTRDVWRIDLEELVGGTQAYLVEDDAVHTDADGDFVWKIMNRSIDSPGAQNERILKVEKIRVTRGDVTIPFLGNWSFVTVDINEGEDFDPERHLIAGKIFVPSDDPEEQFGDPNDWDGDTVILDEGGWLLRPGDLVQVQLAADQATSGFYAPMKAIRFDSGESSVFIAEESDGSTVARRVPVRLLGKEYSDSGEQLLRNFEPLEGETIAEGAELIVEGAHFLVDGEQIVVVRDSEAER